MQIPGESPETVEGNSVFLLRKWDALLWQVGDVFAQCAHEFLECGDNALEEGP